MTEYIIGSDEVGYGAWAGPLVVCAVLVPRDWKLEGLRDSKKLRKNKKRLLYQELSSLEFSLVQVSNDDIDKYGPLNMLMAAHAAAIEEMLHRGRYVKEVVVDGNQLPPQLNAPVRAVVGADAAFPCVSAASVIAKVNRDYVMTDIHHKEFPEYDFENNVGYGSAAHEAALQKHNLTRLHRRTFDPMKTMERGFADEAFWLARARKRR